MPRTRNVTRAQWRAAGSGGDEAHITDKLEENKENEPVDSYSLSTRRRSSRSMVVAARGRDAASAAASTSAAITGRRRAAPADHHSSIVSRKQPIDDTRVPGRKTRVKAFDKRPLATPSALDPTNPSLGRVRTKGGKGKEPMRKKMPLQDITAQFSVYGQPNSQAIGGDAAVNGNPDSPSFRNRVQPLEQPILDLISEKKLGKSTGHVYPSSLPPSSPPSQPSSVVGEGSLLRRFLQDAGSPLPTATSSPTTRRQAPQGVTPPTSPPRNPGQDPFGFLALERRLRAAREEEEAGGRILVQATSDIEREEALRAAPLSTPKAKRRRRERSARRAGTLGVGEGREDEDGMWVPSTPSPKKPETDSKEGESIEEVGEIEYTSGGFEPIVEERSSVIDSGKKRKGGEDEVTEPISKRRRTRAQQQEEKKQEDTSTSNSLDPVGLAKSLGALLPKRGKVRRADREEQSDDEDEDEEGNRRRVKEKKKVKPDPVKSTRRATKSTTAVTTTKNTKSKSKSTSTLKSKAKPKPSASKQLKSTTTTKARPKAKSKSKAAKMEEVDEEAEEAARAKMERERAERVEYFKRLDGYTVAVENVYVV